MRGSGSHGAILPEAIGDWRLAIGDWRLAIGDWRLAIGDWRLAIGDWRLAIGDWRLAIGDWRLAIGDWRLAIGSRQLRLSSAPWGAKVRGMTAALSDSPPPAAPANREATRALALLLTINLFCYLDRYILASILPAVKAEFLAGDPNANSKAGLLTTAFLISYMITAPVFGWLADRFSRWLIIGVSVALWSIASGVTGFATTFAMLLGTRIFLGIGEAGYGPAAPTIISDWYSLEKRGRVLAWFFMAIPVGSALGYAFGGLVNHYVGWRWAFFLVAPPGLILAGLCALMKEPRRSGNADAPKPRLADYTQLLRIPSFVTNVLAQTAMTFAIGGLSVWAPTYIHEERGIPLAQADLVFGGILVVAGIVSTLLGGWLGDKLRGRFPGAYFLVSGSGMLLGFPATIAMLFVPFPYAWLCIFAAMFFLFLNVGPANTALANVTPPAMRATAFALNILVIHALGDALSPWLIGWIKDHGSWNLSFFVVSMAMLLAGVIWLCSMKSLARDTAAIEPLEKAPA